jgi:hypothetical protein
MIEAYVEYNPNTLSKASLKDLLIEYSTQMGELLLE